MIHVRTESTSSEVLRLKGEQFINQLYPTRPQCVLATEELEALQDLHLWRTTKISPNLMEFIYASRFVVSVPCVKLRPVLSQLRIERVKGARLRERDPYPDLTRLMLEGAKHVVSSIPGEIDIRKVRCRSLCRYYLLNFSLDNPTLERFLVILRLHTISTYIFGHQISIICSALACR